MKKTLTACLLAAATLFPASAQAEWLGDREIRQTVGGKLVYLKTSYGAFPLRYGQNGNVTGDGTGLGLARFFAPKETGQWWVENDQLCQKFPTWYRGKTSCFQLQKTGESELRWRRQDGYSGSALVEG